jgi:hypothetical protein
MTTIRTVLIGAVLVTVAIMVFLSFALGSEPALTLEIKRLYLEAYKAVGVGFLVAVLGVSVPQLLPEARDRFERFKNSRVAYSEAKTAVIYLPETVSELTFAPAVAAVQDAHRKLHLAETYSELQTHLIGWHPHPETWVDRNYWELMAIRRALRTSVNTWDHLTSRNRLQIIDSALKVVESVFGPDNQNWVVQDSGDDKWEQKRHRENTMDDALIAWSPDERLIEPSRQTEGRSDGRDGCQADSSMQEAAEHRHAADPLRRASPACAGR